MSQAKRPPVNQADWLAKATKLKGTALAKFDSMPNAQRAVAPAPGQWSATEVVEHLILVEEVVVGLWRERLLQMNSPKAGVKSRLLTKIVSFCITRTNLRVPTVPELEPKKSVDINSLRARWNEARQNLVAALPDDTQAPWILHPAFGPLSSSQMGQILASHLEHHLRHWPVSD